MHSAFNELCNRRYETSLVHNRANDGVHEYGRVGKLTQPLFGIKFLMSTFDHLLYRDIDNSSEGRLLLQSHRLSR